MAIHHFTFATDTRSGSKPARWRVELPEFKEQRKSMKHKQCEAGYSPRGMRKYVRNCVYNSSGILF